MSRPGCAAAAALLGRAVALGLLLLGLGPAAARC